VTPGLWLALWLWSASLSAGAPVSSAKVAPGEPLPGLTAPELDAARRGRAAFEEQKEITSGLGPLFNETSCSRCHNRGGVGGSGFQSVVVAGRLDGGVFDPLSAEGGPILAQASVSLLRSPAERRLIPDCRLPPDGEPVPSNATTVARRRTTALFGLGLVDATPDTTFIDLAARQPAAIRGRAAKVRDPATGQLVVGKLGWKAQFPSLSRFTGAAYRNELGITNPEFPTEQAPLGSMALANACDIVPELEDDGADVRDAAAFVRLLAPVPPLEPDEAARAGDASFTEIGCDGCHVRVLRTGAHDVAALSNREYRPFSDFLLHDMGALADGVGEGDAAPREMRTAPLWGMRLTKSDRLLHDGRAKSLSDAIRLHDGQGAAARAAFVALPERKQQALLAFLRTL
jgi:CxxC motif-containing protein (DUF1111 family)